MDFTENKRPRITRPFPDNAPVPEDDLFEILDLAARILDHLLCW